jgi:large conductance mechanosensitive channel
MAIINFLVIAFVVFMLVRQVNKMKKAEEAAPAPAPAGLTQEELLAQILVALKK